MKPKIILSLLLGYSLAFTATAQPGALDVEFGTNGIVSLVIDPDVRWYEGHAVIEQPDGKILVAGSVGSKAVIARLYPDGPVDTLGPHYFGFEQVGGALVFKGGTYNGTFGTIHLTGSAIDDIALQPDGKIVTVGTVGVGYEPSLTEKNIIFRQKANGAHDPAFGLDGYGFALGTANNALNSAVVIQQDGKILVCSKISWGSGRLARYLPDGQPDSSFASVGETWAGVSTNSILLQPDGKIVVGGSGSFSFSMARFKADGSLDGEFGSDGIAIVDITSSPDLIYSLERLPNDKILAIGKAGDSLAVARFTNGILDLSYGENGIAFVHLNGKRLVGTSSALQSDGKLLVAGYAGPGNGNTDDFLLVRLTPEGDLDDSFGDGGIVLTDVSPRFDRLHAISLQQDGKILVAGYASKEYLNPNGNYTWGTEFIVARYLSGLETGVHDNSISKNEILVYPNPVFDFLSFQLQGQRPPGSSGVFHIVNAQGRLMKTFQSDRPYATFIVPVWEWAAGVYFLQYVEEGVVSQVEKFVILKK
jgi:uncharacterized delta-60 repeat protein